jgi:peroxin-16
MSSDPKPLEPQRHGVSAMGLLEPGCVPNISPLSLAIMWRSYKSFVRQHSILLQLMEDTLSHLLFWTPLHRQDDQWREVLYGLLSLHQLASDMALQDDDDDSREESYGTTVAIVSPSIPATSLRVTITVIHNLMPTALQLTRPEHRPRMRCWVECIKFVLRLALVGSYWQELRAGNNTDNIMDMCGLVQGGALYWPHHEDKGISIQQEEALRQRINYVGRRTGRTVTKIKQTIQSSPFWRVMMGELLHIYRPLHWSLVEVRRKPSLHDWCTTLGIDLVSLLLLRNHGHSPLNRQELQRRKLRLWLYLLRSPIFDRYTEHAEAKTCLSVSKIPLLGSILETYLWDWLLYWKHPFISEQE